MDGEDGNGPVSTFQSLAAEGDILYKQGEIRKAIDAYSKALTLRPTDKNILVQRSKCALQVNDPESALKDAETALAEDKNFYKARLQKAEALYAKGDFEMALVFYHRGHIAKPEVDEFRLGIQKASEAIENSIGDPSVHKLRVPQKESHRAQTASQNANSTANASGNRQQRNATSPSKTRGTTAGNKQQAQSNKSTQENENGRLTRPSGSAESAESSNSKALLGELYADKEYLQKLFEDRDLATNPNTTVTELVREGLKFLETRTEFWRQQKPIYARKKEAAKLHEKVKEARARQSEQKDAQERDKLERQRQLDANRGVAIPYIKAPPNNSDAAIAKFVSENLENIARFQSTNDFDSALKAAKLYQNTVTNMTFANKDGTLLEVYDLVGGLHFANNNMPQALLYYNKELTLAKSCNSEVATSRALGSLGRCYVRQRKFTSALEAWLEKLPLADSATERVWLRNDMGRCYLEINDVRSALEQGEAAIVDANETADPHWQMNINVLLAQSHERQGDGDQARAFYESALKYAHESNDEKAISTIEKAISSSAKEKEKEYATSSDRLASHNATALNAGNDASPSGLPAKLTAELKQDSQRRSSEGISLIK